MKELTHFAHDNLNETQQVWNDIIQVKNRYSYLWT